MYYNGYGYTTTSAATGLAALTGALLVFVIFLLIIGLAAAIVYLIGTMKVLKKAGKPSWGAWVPGYSSILLCESAGIDPRWVLISIYSSVLSIVPILGWIAMLVVVIYYTILLEEKF